jgi:outer membrane receptor protein involved in Fe transport
MDLNLTYTVAETNYGKLSASVDVFNVFDNDEPTRVVEQGLIRTSGNVLTARSPYYGLPRSYQSPRSLRFGLRYEF